MGYIGQGLSFKKVANLTIEGSAITGAIAFYTSYLGETPYMTTSIQSLTIRNSSVIHNDTLLDFEYFTDIPMHRMIEIFIEYTDLKATRAPPHIYNSQRQPPFMEMSLGGESENISVNFTVSKCNFFNFFDSTALAVDMQEVLYTKDVYFSILDSHFYSPFHYFSGNNIEITQGLVQDLNVHTRFTGNTFKPPV